MNSSSNNTLYFILGALVIAIIAVVFLSMPDRRTSGERIGDAMEALPQGPGKAIDQLGDRTPADKAGDALQKGERKVEKAAQDATSK